MAKECINWNQDWLRHLIKKHLKEDLIEILFLPIYNVHPVFNINEILSGREGRRTCRLK